MTKEIHNALARHKISGAQHGTSGNNSERLRHIASETATTKANVATALQMISWGVKVNEFGNAFLDENGEFLKLSGEGVSESLWNEMAAYAKSKGIKAGDYKKLNLPFENKMLGQTREIRERMAKGVEDFVYDLLTNVFNTKDTAPLAIEAILKAGSFNMGPKADRIENEAEWTEAKIRERALKISDKKGPEGNFDD
jgi:hypothetical protein